MVVPVVRAEDYSTGGSTITSSEESQEEGLELELSAMTSVVWKVGIRVNLTRRVQ